MDGANRISAFREQIKTNPYLQVVALGAAGVLSGGVVILFYLVFILPSISQNLWNLIPVALGVALAGFLVNYVVSISQVRPLLEFLRKERKGEQIDEQSWHNVRQAIFILPQVTAVNSFLLWPGATTAFGLVEFLLGNFNGHESFVIALSGYLIGPINALAYFFGVRRIVRRFLARLEWYPLTPRDEKVRMFSIRRKLVAGFLILSICPMIFAVLIDRAQGRMAMAQDRMETVQEYFQDIEEAFRTMPDKSGKAAWKEAIAKVQRNAYVQSPGVMVVDEKGEVLVNPPEEGTELDRSISRPLSWWRPIQGDSYLSGSGRYLVYRQFKTDKVFLMAAIDPFPPVSGWWRRNGLTAFLLVLLGVIGVGLGTLAAMDTSEPIQVLSAASERLAEGKFRKIGAFLPDDELGLLGNTFKHMIEMLAEQARLSEEINSTIFKTLESLSAESKAVLEQTSRQTMGMSEQTQFAEDAHNASQEITDTAHEIQEQAQAIEETAEETMNACEQGRVVLDDANRGITAINSEMQNIAGQIEVLGGNYESIETIVSMINDISDRTEMLALNAALEAAGAGEAGKRFATVAQEVKRLVDRTKESTSEIRNLVQIIRSSSLKASKAIEDGLSAASSGTELMTRLASSYETIAGKAEKTTKAVREITGMTEKQSLSTDQLFMIISEVRRVSQVVNDSTQKTESSIRSLMDLSSNLFQKMKDEK